MDFVDIDKAYIMGYEFDNNGTYVGWSPYFRYDSLKNLHLSEQLPTPNGTRYVQGDSINAVDITQEVLQLKESNYWHADKLPVLIELLHKIEDATELTYNDQLVQQKDFDEILGAINRHSLYMVIEYDKKGRIKGNKIKPKQILPAFKNATSSKIGRIIQDIRNMASAYTPINMDEPKSAAKHSSLGEKAKRTTYQNPASTWGMTVQNMDGKDTIGITAVGEKIFFAASYYFNECVNTGNDKWFKRAFFTNVLDRIQRIRMQEGEDPIPATSVRNIIANVNFNQNPEMADKWKALVKAVMLEETNTDGTPMFTQESIRMQLETQFGLQGDQSLVISALLSAATDNAKELILSKINAGPMFAGMYLHLIMLNFNFDDIAAFMTSPTVQTIADLCKSNIFDDYHDQGGSGLVNSVIKSLKEGPDIRKYLSVDNLNYLYYHSSIKDTKEYAENAIGTPSQKFKRFLKDAFQKGIELTPSNFPIDQAFMSGTMQSINAYRFKEEFEFLQAKAMNLDPRDFEVFETVKKQSQETTDLGRLLGINQGMATDLPGKLQFLDFLNDVFNKAVKTIKYDNADNFVKELAPKHKQYTEEELRDIYERAKAQDLFDNFDALKFLNTDEVEYRQAVIDLHSLAKTIWPVFDMLDKIPHYRALYQILNLTELVDSHMSNKFKLIRELKKVLIQRGVPSYFNEDKYKALASAVDEYQIIKWLQSKNIEFTLPKGSKYLRDGIFKELDSRQTFNLGTDDGRATFKYWMESTLIPQLKQGRVDGKLRIGLRTNKFIQEIQGARRIDSFTKDQVNYYKLPIDLSDRKTESEKARVDKYVEGLIQLKDINLQGRSIADWIVLYNLIVNHDMYGSDRLTSILGSLLRFDDSLTLDNKKTAGESDYIQDADINEMSIDDLLVKLAPIVATNQLYNTRDLFVRIRDRENNRYDIYKQAEQSGKTQTLDDYEDYDDNYNDSYIDSDAVSTGGSNSAVIAKAKQEGFVKVTSRSLEQDRDYSNYYTLRSPEQTRLIRSLHMDTDQIMRNGKVKKKSIDYVVDKLRGLMGRNSIQIRIDCE